MHTIQPYACVPYGQQTHATATVGDSPAHIPHCVQYQDPSFPPQNLRYRQLGACPRALDAYTKQNKKVFTEHKAENNIPKQGDKPRTGYRLFYLSIRKCSRPKAHSYVAKLREGGVESLHAQADSTPSWPVLAQGSSVRLHPALAGGTVT